MYGVFGIENILLTRKDSYLVKEMSTIIMEIKILYENDTELAEYEALNEGYRNDVIVVIGEKKYKMYITSPLRLQQYFETEQEDCGFYMA